MALHSGLFSLPMDTVGVDAAQKAWEGFMSAARCEALR